MREDAFDLAIETLGVLEHGCASAFDSCRNGPSAASLEQVKPTLIDACKRPTQGQQSSQREPNPFRREMLLCSYLLQVEAFPPGQRSEAHGTRNV